ncbi:MAG: hypothetical protein ACRDTE_32585 [Pseudonocardiaceae bacterium]
MTAPSGLTLDAGALIAVERGDRRLRVLLDETERAGLPIVVPVGYRSAAAHPAAVHRAGAGSPPATRIVGLPDRRCGQYSSR